MTEEKNYIGYEYKKLSLTQDEVSFYLDCYESFGWKADDNFSGITKTSVGNVTLNLKRDRKIINKAELTRLQRNFEACMAEIKKLERAKTSNATAWSLTVGGIGTVFMAGSVFAVTNDPPIIWLCVLLAIPAFIGWGAPIFIYRSLKAKKESELQPLIEAKQDEIYEICEKGNSLL